eukprot:353183-Chlamydomonas_euryale.AAC.1
MATHNVRGLVEGRHQQKLEQLLDRWFVQLRLDIVLVQETLAYSYCLRPCPSADRSLGYRQRLRAAVGLGTCQHGREQQWRHGYRLAGGQHRVGAVAARQRGLCLPGRAPAPHERRVGWAQFPPCVGTQGGTCCQATPRGNVRLPQTSSSRCCSLSAVGCFSVVTSTLCRTHAPLTATWPTLARTA